MENPTPAFVEVTHLNNRKEIPDNADTSSASNNAGNEAILRAIAETGMDLLKQMAKERVSKAIEKLQEKGTLNPQEGKQVLEQLQQEAEAARLRAEAHNKQPLLFQVSENVPTLKQYTKLKKRVNRLEQEVRELRSALLLLSTATGLQKNS